MLVAVVSAKGSPGVTDTAVALAAVWPREAYVADLDPAGGDLWARFRDPRGEPLDPDVGLISLAAALRRGGDPGAVDVEEHLQAVGGGLPVLAGLSSPEQLSGMGPVWPTLARVLSGTGADVVADCGRVTAASPVTPVVAAADLVVVLTRDVVSELAHVRARLRWLAGTRTAPGRVAVLVRAPERHRGAAADVQRLLHSSDLDVPVLGVVADDPRGARALEHADARRASRSALVRSVRAVVPAVQAAARSHQGTAAAPAGAAGTGRGEG